MMRHMSMAARAARRLIVMGTVALTLLASKPCWAVDTVDLIVSNLLPLETSPPYATVTLTQLASNKVELRVTPTTVWYSSTNTNFGIAGFAFNCRVALNPGDIKWDPM